MTRKLLTIVSVAAACGLLLVYGASKSPDTNFAAAQNPRENSRRPQRRAAPAAQDDPTNAEYLDRLLVAARDGGAHVLSTGDSYDDFASIAQSSDGTLFVAYAAYYNGHDQI